MKLEVAFGPGLRPLAVATEKYLRTSLHATGAKIATPIADNIPWTPSFWYKDSEGIQVAIEVSETVYPRVLSIAYAALINRSHPLRVIVVAPHEAFTAETDLGEDARLKADGFGLWTINKTGVVNERFRGVLLNQVIAEESFVELSREFKKKTRERLRACFEKYRQEPLSGLRDITEVAEATGKAVLQQALKAGLQLNVKQQKAGLATKLDYVMASGVLKTGNAELSGLRSYLTRYRNFFHHAPETEAESLKRLQRARQGFLEGTSVIGAAHARFGLAK
jgi:hypothetical protein